VTTALAALPDSGAAVPSRFTMRQLEYFVATCDAGSVTEAALSIPVSQSSVSAGVSQLEAALGVQLFVRHHAQSVHPTSAGREFLGCATVPRWPERRRDANPGRSDRGVGRHQRLTSSSPPAARHLSPSTANG
jgi:DNA-binding transcriptional LysR family regulator